MKGAARIGRWRGVPVFIHWTTPIGFLFFLGIQPAMWLLFAGVILMHEWGHAVLIRKFGALCELLLGASGRADIDGWRRRYDLRGLLPRGVRLRRRSVVEAPLPQA